MQPLSLYIHIPFCNVKCKYCAFYTLPKQNTKFRTYFEALFKEIELVATELQPFSIKTIYIGGGTPSLVNPVWIKELLERIYASCTIDPDIEVTMEANPESITTPKLEVYRQTPINRLSIGLQAWQDHLLRYLGRTYQNKDFTKRIDLVKQAGFTNFNIDLIFGIPNQTMADWRESLDQVIALNPNHLSCYSLELDNNSFFGVLYKKGRFTPVKESLDRAMYRVTKRKLIQAGYDHYEISNFARKGYECQHNLQFWQGISYLGLGAGAHSFINETHFHNIEDLDRYMAMLAHAELPRVDQLRLSEQEVIIEKLIIGLRLNQGVEIDSFNRRFNVDLMQVFAPQLTYLLTHKLISTTANRLRLTSKGQDLENQVALAFA